MSLLGYSRRFRRSTRTAGTSTYTCTYTHTRTKRERERERRSLYRCYSVTPVSVACVGQTQLSKVRARQGKSLIYRQHQPPGKHNRCSTRTIPSKSSRPPTHTHRQSRLLGRSSENNRDRAIEANTTTWHKRPPAAAEPEAEATSPGEQGRKKRPASQIHIHIPTSNKGRQNDCRDDGQTQDPQGEKAETQQPHRTTTRIC